MMNRTLRILGPVSVALVALDLVLGFWVTPPDQNQGDYARFLYIHPALAWVALYVAIGMAALCSALYLWKRTRSLKYDRLAAAAVEVGVVFIFLTLVTGSIWGHPVWGVWWTWDARLTSTALLGVLFVGYLALRRVPADPEVRAKRCAAAALFAAVDVPICHFSVQWWQTLHQTATVFGPDAIKIHGSMAWTMLLSFIGFSALFAWMVLLRYRIEVNLSTDQDLALEDALAERRAEGVTS